MLQLGSLQGVRVFLALLSSQQRGSVLACQAANLNLSMLSSQWQMSVCFGWSLGPDRLPGCADLLFLAGRGFRLACN